MIFHSFVIRRYIQILEKYPYWYSDYVHSFCCGKGITFPVKGLKSITFDFKIVLLHGGLKLIQTDKPKLLFCFVVYIILCTLTLSSNKWESLMHINRWDMSVSSRWLRRLSPLWRCVAVQVQCQWVDRGVPHAEGPRVPQLLCDERSAVCGGVGQHRTLWSRSGLLGGLTAHVAPYGQLLHHHMQWPPVCHWLSDWGGHHDHPELRCRHQPLGRGQLWTAAPMVLHTKNCDPQRPHLLCQVSFFSKRNLYTFIYQYLEFS